MKRWTAYDRALIYVLTDWAIIVAIFYVVVAVTAAAHHAQTHITLTTPTPPPFINRVLG